MNVLVTVVLLVCLFSPFSLASDQCRLGLSPVGVDFGSLTRAELFERSGSFGEGGSFGGRTLHLRIQCAVPRAMTWGFVATMADAQRYRWSAGTFQIRIIAARLDGMAVRLRRAGDDAVEADLLRPGERLVTWRSGAVVQGGHLEVELRIEAHVDETMSRVRDLTRHEAQGTFLLD